MIASGEHVAVWKKTFAGVVIFFDLFQEIILFVPHTFLFGLIVHVVPTW